MDEVEASEGDVELGLVGELEDHEFERGLVGLFDDAESHVAGDAVFDVDHVIAYGEVAEVGDEGGCFGFAAPNGGAGFDVGVVGEVLCAEDDDLAGCGFVEIEYLDAGSYGGLDDDGGAEVASEVAGFGVNGGAAGLFVARAQAVGDLVLLQEAGEALYFALIGGGEQDAGVLCHQELEGVDEGGDAAVEALGGAGGEVYFGEVAAVGVEDVDEA